MSLKDRNPSPSQLRWAPPSPFGRGVAIVFAALLSAATPALAQDRTPAQRQTLVELAYVLGQSHALRQACMGPDDQYWRERMTRLVATESPDNAFDTRLRNAFNAGFAASQAEFPACGPDSRAEEAKAALHGKGLASTLAREMAGDASVR